MKIFMTILLSSNMVLAASSNQMNFNKAKKSLIFGTFKGKSSYTSNPCTATLKKEDEQIVAIINFISWDNKKNTSKLYFNPSHEDELSFDADVYGEEEQRTANLSKSKKIPEPDNEGYELTIIKSVVQEIDGDRLLSFSLEEAVVNEHSDPSESSLECRINL